MAFVLSSLTPVIDADDFTLFFGWPESGMSSALKDIFEQLNDDSEHVLFIPYQRAGLIYVYEQVWLKDVLDNLADRRLKNYMLHFVNAKEKIKRNEISDAFILDIISVFVDAKPVVTKEGWLMFKENDALLNPEIYTAMANEVTNMLLPLIDLQTPAYVLIEYPEAHVHPAYQILLSLAFLSLVQHGYKFVIATESDYIASFIGDMVRYNVNKEQIVNVVKKIFRLDTLSPTIERIIDEAEKTIKESKLKAYYFENGIAKEFPVRELTYNVPGVTKEVIDVIVDWETEPGRDD